MRKKIQIKDATDIKHVTDRLRFLNARRRHCKLKIFLFNIARSLRIQQTFVFV